MKRKRNIILFGGIFFLGILISYFGGCIRSNLANSFDPSVPGGFLLNLNFGGSGLNNGTGSPCVFDTDSFDSGCTFD